MFSVARTNVSLHSDCSRIIFNKTGLSFTGTCFADNLFFVFFNTNLNFIFEIIVAKIFAMNHTRFLKILICRQFVDILLFLFLKFSNNWMNTNENKSVFYAFHYKNQDFTFKMITAEASSQQEYFPLNHTWFFKNLICRLFVNILDFLFLKNRNRNRNWMDTSC